MGAQISVQDTNFTSSLDKKKKHFFFQMWHTNGQQVYDNVLKTTNHQENTNQNHNDISPVMMVIIKKTNGDKIWWRYGAKGTLLHCWWECKLV